MTTSKRQSNSALAIDSLMASNKNGLAQDENDHSLSNSTRQAENNDDTASLKSL